jgi:hypothetical protein
MKILGYTDDKELVAVELPVDRIVAEGIDPWRLDLLDEQPISLEIDGKLVYFRKLEDVAFFDERSSPGSMVTGVFDRNGKTVFLQDDGNVPFHPKGNTKVSDRPFDEHLREYLVALGKSFHTASGLFEIPASRLVFDRNRGVDGHETLRLVDFCPLYVGEMCSEITIPFQFPDELNFVFRRFGKWNPIITEQSLIQLMSHQPLGPIYFIVDNDGIPEISNATDLDVCDTYNQIKVTVGNCVYVVSAKDAPSGVAAWSSRWREGRQSARCLYSSAEDQVRGLRIALHDVAHMQSRRLFCATNPDSPRNLRTERQNKKREDQSLVEAGFSIIDGAKVLAATERVSG